MLLAPLKRSSTGPALPIAAAICLLFVVLLVRLSWTGHVESDDVFYAAAAEGWVWHFPYLAHTHWGLRHTIVLPMALAFRLFGQTEAALEAPMLLYYAALLVLVFGCVRRVSGAQTAVLATAITAAVPAIAFEASIVVDDLPEAFFVMASAWAFLAATERGDRRLFVLSGAVAGLGFLTRETTGTLLVFYAILFLFDYGGDRLAYVWMGGGFLLIVGADVAALGWASGDPLYRLHVSLSKVTQVVGSRGSKGFEATENLDKPRWLLPLLITFLHQRIGLLFWLAVPATAVLAVRGTDSPQRRMIRLLGGLALVWFLVLGYAVPSRLYVLPRLQMVTAVCLCVVLAIALVRLFATGYRFLAVAAAAALLATDLLLIVAAQKNPLFGERALAGYVAEHPAEMYTDPGTELGARWLLASAGLTDRVDVAPPPPGALYFYDPTSRRGLPPDWPVQAPEPGWQLVARFAEQPTLLARTLHRSGVERMLPHGLAIKLDPPARVASVWRVPGGSPAG